jgi:hypothetical protein
MRNPMQKRKNNQIDQKLFKNYRKLTNRIDEKPNAKKKRTIKLIRNCLKIIEN